MKLDLWIAERDEVLHVARVERLNRAAVKLHVVLRHCLLPQPCGFESFALAGICDARGNLAVAQRVDVEDALAHGDTALAPNDSHVNGYHEMLADRRQRM